MWHWISSIADKRWFMFTPHWNPSRWNKTKKFHWWTKCKQATSRQTNTLHIKSTGWWHDEHLEIVGTHINTEFQWSIINLCEGYVNSWRTPRKVLVLQYWEICVICWPSLKQLPCNCLCNVLNDLTVKDLL